MSEFGFDFERPFLFIGGVTEFCLLSYGLKKPKRKKKERNFTMKTNPIMLNHTKMVFIKRGMKV